MAALVLKQFGGIAPMISPRYLQDTQAQIALNCPVFTGSLQAIADLGDTVHTVTGGTKTIYRYGQEEPSDTNYWFEWPKTVDVCRGQIAGDVSEWTFFSGDGKPQATYNALALGNGAYPSQTRPLGLPAPTSPCQTNVVSKTGEVVSAEVELSRDTVDSIIASEGISISLTSDIADAYTLYPLEESTADAIVAALASSTDVTASASSGAVTITTVEGGADVTLYVKYAASRDYDLKGDFTPDGILDETASGYSDTLAELIINDGEIGTIDLDDLIVLKVNDDTVINKVSLRSRGYLSVTPENLAQFINDLTASSSATAYGGQVFVKPRSNGAYTFSAGSSVPTGDDEITYQRITSENYADAGDDAYPSITLTEKGTDFGSPASIMIPTSTFNDLRGLFVRFTVNGLDHDFEIPDGAEYSRFYAAAGYGVSVTVIGVISPVVRISTTAIGANATLSLVSGTFPFEPNFVTDFGAGTTSDLGTKETRTYTWTWVNKESGFEFESAPAEAASSVDVYPDQNVIVSNFADVPGSDYLVTHRRIYRSTSGIFLFVADVDASTAQFTDDVLPEALGEEMPSIDWSEPPEDLRGLINLPNGMMAGHVGRDIYFCEPYRPFAWPEKYIQTIDYPVVGFGRMDTTLVVLTTGNPYLIQGSHPSNTAVVKSDLEQSCVSKDSIVSYGGVVMYAAPDGLMMLSSSGSKIVTEGIFNFTQWQQFFKPESIHAYQHDNQYIAFYDNGETKGGFTYDIRSNQFITHDIWAEGGFHDVVQDKLYMVLDTGEIKVWGRGTPKEYTWRSKKFSMPAITGFSCAQLEAEAYPMTLRVYVDGVQTHEQTVQNREPFRLPPQVGRDWEVEIQGLSEVFSVAVAHSPTELGNG